MFDRLTNLRDSRVLAPVLAAAAIAVLGFSAVPARAALLEFDLFAAGDKLVTRDTNTGLDWLDVTSTLGLSYNQAEASSFVTALGFRHATVAEVQALYSDFGIGIQDGSFVGANFAGAEQLISLMGCTDCSDSLFAYQGGLANMGDPLLAAIPYTHADLWYLEAQSFFETPVGKGDVPSKPAGNYLVRLDPPGPYVAVPEPMSLSLISFGLIAIGAFRRRRTAG
ncbi:MAG: PEP-CTERM sorting domain-containing protein [Alphaproteobacteria bacterium]